MSYIRKPFNIRSKCDYEQAEAVLTQLKNTTVQLPKQDWSYQYSKEKTAFDHVREIILKEMSYFEKKMREYKHKFPEEFI